jgi:hypothetical protein
MKKLAANFAESILGFLGYASFQKEKAELLSLNRQPMIYLPH